MKDDTYDYESHKEWAERVPDVRPDYGPRKLSPWVPIFGAMLATVGIALAIAALFIIPGVMTWR